MDVRRIAATLAAGAVALAVPAASARAADAAPTWKITVNGTLVSSSAHPHDTYAAPELFMTPGHSATMSLTIQSSISYQLNLGTYLDLAGSQPSDLPPGVSVTVTGASCSPSGGTMHAVCDSTPAGTHTFDFTFSVSPDSPYLRAQHVKTPAADPYAFIDESASPYPLNTYGAFSGSFGVQVATGSASAPPTTAPASHPATARAAATTTAASQPTATVSSATSTAATSPSQNSSTSAAQGSDPTTTAAPSVAAPADAPSTLAAASAGASSSSSTGTVLVFALVALVLAGGGGMLFARRRRTSTAAPGSAEAGGPDGDGPDGSE